MPTILIADDDALDRETAEGLLKKIDGIQVHLVTNGEEALDFMAGRTPDLILTDLRMPRMDGLELVRIAREEFPSVPIVLMTSKGNEKTAVEALQSGAASYIPKQMLEDDLVEIVQGVLEMAAARRSAEEITRFIDQSETRFTLENQPRFIPPLVGFLQENLSRIGFATQPERMQIAMALSEAISNAMIHGNLEVSSELRKNSHADYDTLIRERTTEAPYSSRRVRLSVRENPTQVEYVIADEGPGFDTAEGPDPTAPENLLKPSGRGLFLIRTFMDAVTFNDAGNEIRMRKTAVE